LAKTAYEVQLAVRKQVTNMTGKPVEKVDVVIEGVKMPAVEQKDLPPGDDGWTGQGDNDSN
jgi:uncharacterized alkaline shock family protein YloU